MADRMRETEPNERKKIRKKQSKIDNHIRENKKDKK